MLRIGIQPANSGPLATPAYITELAETADALGFDSCLITDHVVVPVQLESRYPYNATGRFAASPDTDYFEPLSLLGYLAGRTRRIRLGTSVLIAGYRNPLATAKQLACLDVLSGGRIVIGLGVGWMAEEFAALDGAPFEQRGRATDEAIEIYRRAWREQPVAFEGRVYRFDPVGVMPKPVQPGGIPILIGGNSRPAIRRAARLGDGWQPIKLAPEELASKLDYLRAEAEAAGRDLTGFQISHRLGLRLSATDTARRPGEDPAQVLVGTPDQVAAELAVFERLGVTDVVFDFRTCTAAETRETVELAGRHLVPQPAAR